MDVPYHFGRGWSRLIPYLLLLPGLLLYLVLGFGPSLATAFFSFTDVSGVPGGSWHWIGLSNYYEFLFLGVGARDNIEPLVRTLIFCFFVTTVQTSISLLIAILLNLKLIGTNFYRALFFIPTVLGVTVNGMIWNLFLYPLDGPAQSILKILGTRSNFLGSPDTAFAWVIFVQIWANMGFSMVVFLAGLQNISKELIEAGLIDGASPWQSFYYITYPLLAPTLTTNIMLAVIGSLQSWAIVLVLTAGQFKTSVLGYQIYQNAFGGGMRQGYAASISMIQFLMILIVALAVQTYLRRREERLS